MANVFLVGRESESWNSFTGINYFILSKFQAGLSGVGKKIMIYGTYATGNAKTAIYSDSGGSPDALLAAASAISVHQGWAEASISDVNIVSGNYYWLAWNCDTSMCVGGNNTGTNKYKSATYSSFSFPDPAGTGFSSYTYQGVINVFGEISSSDPEGSLVGGKLIRGGLLLHGVLGR